MGLGGLLLGWLLTFIHLAMEGTKVFWFGEAAKVLISTVEISATFLLALSIYRFPLRYAYGKVALICFIVSVLGTVMRDWARVFEYATLSMLITSFVLTFLVFKLPAFFSMIVSISTLLIAIILELAVAVVGIRLDMGNTYTVLESTTLYVLQDSIVTIICLIIIIILQKYKLGLTFLINLHRKNNQFLKRYNYVISIILIGFVSIAQLSFFTIMPYAPVVSKSIYLIKFLFSFFYFVVFLFFITIAYRKSKLETTLKYNYLDASNQPKNIDL
jgi:hypothetical protein